MKSESVAAILTHLGLDTRDAGSGLPPRQLNLIWPLHEATSRGLNSHLVCQASVGSHHTLSGGTVQLRSTDDRNGAVETIVTDDEVFILPGDRP